LIVSFKYIDADKMRVATAGDGKIYAGVPDKDKRTFVGVIRDVTSDCLKAVADKLEREQGGTFVICANGVPTHEITVRRLGTTQ